MDIHALGRGDITAFLNRLAFLQSEGQISAKLRPRAVRELRRTLGQMRALGLTCSGQPLHGLPDDFSIAEETSPVNPRSRPPAEIYPLK